MIQKNVVRTLFRLGQIDEDRVDDEENIFPLFCATEAVLRLRWPWLAPFQVEIRARDPKVAATVLRINVLKPDKNGNPVLFQVEGPLAVEFNQWIAKYFEEGQ